MMFTSLRTFLRTSLRIVHWNINQKQGSKIKEIKRPSHASFILWSNDILTYPLVVREVGFENLQSRN